MASSLALALDLPKGFSAPRYLVWVHALVTGILHFFMVLCALCDSEVLFRKPPGLINAARFSENILLRLAMSG